MRVYELPEGNRNSKGRALQNLLNIEPGDSVRTTLRCKQLDDPVFTAEHYLVFATANGLVKKTSLTEYARVMAKGKKAILMRPGDTLVGVELTDGDSEILLANRTGRAVRFHESDLRSMGRVSSGVRGMTLEEGDSVVGLVAVKNDSDTTIMVLSQTGSGKRTPLEAYRITRRGAKGVKTMKITERTGELVAFKSVDDDMDMVIINKSGITLRVHVADIRVMSRATQGVRIINLDKRGDTIASACCVPADPEQEVVAVAPDAEQLTGEEIDPQLDEEIEDELPDDDEDTVADDDEIIDESANED